MNAPTLHRGRLARAPRILSVRPLVREDLAVLLEKRVPGGRVKELRAHHHRIAYMFASKMMVGEIAEVTGMSLTRLYQLRDNPAFKQLITECEPEALPSARAVVDEFARLKFENAMRAERLIAERLEAAEESDDPDLIPLKTLLPISQDFGDRFGYGKKETRTNEVKDFAAMMEQIQAASGRSSVIDAKANPLPAVAPAAGHPSPTELPSLARRRG